MISYGTFPSFFIFLQIMSCTGGMSFVYSYAIFFAMTAFAAPLLMTVTSVSSALYGRLPWPLTRYARSPVVVRGAAKTKAPKVSRRELPTSDWHVPCLLSSSPTSSCGLAHRAHQSVCGRGPEAIHRGVHAGAHQQQHQLRDLRRDERGIQTRICALLAADNVPR